MTMFRCCVFPITASKLYCSVFNDEVEETGGYIRNTNILGLMPVNKDAKRIIFDGSKSWKITIRFKYLSSAGQTQCIVGNNSANDAYYLTPSMEISQGGSSIIGRASSNGSSWTTNLTVSTSFSAGNIYKTVFEWDGTILTLRLYDDSDTLIDSSSATAGASNFSGLLAFGAVGQKSYLISNVIGFDFANCELKNNNSVLW